MDWLMVENEVRTIASSLWDADAIPETIAGIKCDCVVKKESNYWYVVEITKERTLDKLRIDLAKLFTVRNFLSTQNIYVKCYFISEKAPTDSIRASASAQFIEALSINEFRKRYFDFDSYKFRRNQMNFGSLVNIDSGKPEINTYIPVMYKDQKSGEMISIQDIKVMLLQKRIVILKGNYGTGKSRCLHRLFELVTERNEGVYPIAINLRDHWGTKYAIDLLTRHFIDVGVSSSNFMKSYVNDNVIYLLDGFDEIGTQTWSDDVKKMQHIRAASVVAVKDLLRKVNGGVLITGREHYFNSDNEMLDSFGLNNNENVSILECSNEFTISEIVSYIQKYRPHIYRDDFYIPEWLPRRPLILDIVIKYAEDLLSRASEGGNICSFWNTFLDKLCIRESEINAVLNPNVIKQILIFVGRITRNKINNIGPISLNELAIAFEKVVGMRPNDESSILLQRLPGLGRINADSPDRQFIDNFILNGLRAEDVIQSVNNNDRNLMLETWKNPIDQHGANIMAEYIHIKGHRVQAFIAYAKYASMRSNQVLASDIVASVLLCDIKSIDFLDAYIKDTHLSSFICSDKQISNITIESSIIEYLDITNAELNCVNFLRCEVQKIIGIPSERGLPACFTDNRIESFETIGTVSRIKKANLSNTQKVFITIIKKLFFQPGRGRREEALLRGLGESSNKKIADKIVHKLLEEKIIAKTKGDQGVVYVPEREYAGRLDKILTQLTLSKDPLWVYISGLN